MSALFTASLEKKGSGLLNHIYVLMGYVSALVVLTALTSFSEYPPMQQRIVLTVGFLGLAAVYWISCLISSKDNPITLTFRRPTLDAITPVIFVLMILAGMIDPLPQPVVPSPEIPFLSLIRGSFTLGVSLVLPGLLVFSLINSTLRPLLRFLIAVHLSFAMILMMTYSLYYTKGSTDMMYPAIIILIAALWSFRLLLKRNGNHMRSRITLGSSSLLGATNHRVRVSKWTISLSLMVTASIAVGFAFHDSQPYMIPGDAWRVLQPGVDLISGRDISETTLVSLEYPIAYGFLMAGLSAIAGIPIVNVNLFLFPFVALNLLSFYALVKYAFGVRQEIATIASFFYGFGGGFGWLMGRIHEMNVDFWTLSYKTQDMLFSYYFLDNVEFWHRTLAMTFGFMAILAFQLGIGKDNKRKWALFPVAALFLVAAYMIHMLPLIFVFPVFLYLWYARAKRSWLVLFTIAVSAIGIFSISDLLLNGYYSSLTYLKISKELLPDFPVIANPGTGFIVLFSGAGLAASLLVLIHRRRKRKSATRNPQRHIEVSETQLQTQAMLTPANRKPGDRILRFSSPAMFSLVLVGIYLYGIAVWSTFPASPGLLYDINQLPWYYIPIRFGFVGLLAIASLFFVRSWRSWTNVSLVWVLAVFMVGNIWWGPKVLSFLYPVLALLAGVTIYRLIEIAPLIRRIFKLNGLSNKLAASVGAMALIGLVVLSTSSHVYGLSHYYSTPTPKDPSVFSVVSWIYSNVPKDAKVVIYSQDYPLEVGVSSLSAHETIISKEWEEISIGRISTELQDRDLRYFVGNESEVPSIIVEDALPVHRTGSLTVLLLEPSSSVNYAMFVNKGSGTLSSVEETGQTSFSKEWQITWSEQVGVTLKLEESIPKNSIVSFDLNLDQSRWNTPSSVQELSVRFGNGGPEAYAVSLIDELDGVPRTFVFTVDREVAQIEFVAVNGGTNNASLTVSDIRYLTPNGIIVDVSTHDDLS